MLSAWLAALSAGLGPVLALRLTMGLAGPWEPFPTHVREMCGEPPIAAESLCNVEAGLQDTYLLVERIAEDAGDALPSRIGALVRDRLVSVEWHPDPDPTSVSAGLVGMYDAATHRVSLRQGLREEPLRVRASVVAHELGHAALHFDGAGAQLRPAEACLQNEAEAFKVGMIVYERARRLDDEPAGGEGSVDRHLAGELDAWWQLSGGKTFTPAGLDDLANRHIFLHGYAVDCNWRPSDKEHVQCLRAFTSWSPLGSSRER
jgi:hypothetical protein